MRTYTCSGCGATKTEAIERLAHTMDWVKVDDNKDKYYCSVCNYIEKEENHTWGTGAITTETSCNAPGVRTYTCSKCKATKTEAIEKLSHSYTAWTYNTLENHKKSCNNGCGDVQTEAHSWVLKTTVPATCKAAGSRSYECSVCKGTKTEVIPTTEGHTLPDNWSKNDTATHKKVCTVCAVVITEAHKWQAGAVTKPATCIAKGETPYSCTVCGETKTEPIEMIPHSYTKYEKLDTKQHKISCSTAGCTAFTKEDHTWNAGVVTTEPTCTEKGVKTFTCSKCAETKKEEIAAKGHSYGPYTSVNETSHERVCTVETCKNKETTSHNFPATWTKLSDTQHARVCADCKYQIKVDHTWDAGRVTTAAACLKAGVMTYTCTASGCGATKTEAIKALEHIPGTEEVITPAKCTVDGLKGVKCITCGEVLSSTVIPQPGHTLSVRHIIRDAACGVEGVEGIDCTVCGEIIDGTPIPALSHIESGWVTRQKATCDKNGTSIRYCTLCNQTLERRTTKALGHKAGEPVVTKQATYTQTGLASVYCTVCNALIEEISTDMLLIKQTTEVQKGFDIAVTNQNGEKLAKILRTSVDAQTGEKQLIVIITDETAMTAGETANEDQVHLTPEILNSLENEGIDNVTLYIGDISVALPLKSLAREDSGKAMPAFTLISKADCEFYRETIRTTLNDMALMSDMYRMTGLTDGELGTAVMPTGLSEGQAGQEKFQIYLIYENDGYMIAAETTYIVRDGMIFACASVPANVAFALMQTK